MVRPETAGRLARAGAAAGAEVVMPETEGETGHPPLLGPALRAEILAAEPAGGLRELLLSRPERVLRVPVDDPGALHDADTAGDLERLRGLSAAEDLPSEARCLRILDMAGVAPQRVAHCRAVAAVAAALTAGLDEQGECLCIPLVVAAALLHDVARAEPKHGDAGAALLERLGHARVARVVRNHMRLGDALVADLDETQIVYLADKLVQDDRLVGVDARFAVRFERWAGDPAALEGVRERLEEARLVQARVETVLGRPLAL